MAMSIRRRGIARFARRKAERRLAVLGPIIWFRGAKYAVSRTDCISFSRVDWACADFSCSAWSCNGRQAYPMPWPRYIPVSQFPGPLSLLHFRRRGFLFLSLAAFLLGQTEQRGDRLTDPRRLVLLFQLRL